MKRTIAAFAAALFCCTAPAFAWGTKGHEIVNRLAAESFPAALPAFLRTPSARYEIMYLGPEEDRLKGSGTAWDDENDPGHYLDILDNGTVANVVALNNLPRSREAYDTALRAAGTDQYKQGYSPYAILEGWQQLRDDFAYWRVDDYLTTHGSAMARADAVRNRAIDEALTLRDLGVWGHFVADACQPLHMTVHFNGWGKYPNPEGYSQSRETHSNFESVFVDKFVTLQDVRAQMKGSAPLPVSTTRVPQRTALAAIASYLRTSAQTVPELYQIEKAGGFASGSPQAVAFTASRLAAGAMELRDLVVWAWNDSLNNRVGYPYHSVRDILSGNAPMSAGD